MTPVSETPAKSLSASVEIRDYSLWIKHIHGNAKLVSLIEGLHQDDRIELCVGGHMGVWIKKKNGTTGLPTPGLKPVGPMREIWFDWFKTRRGELVDIALVGDLPAATEMEESVRPRFTAGDDAAWAAFLDLGMAGWRLEADRPHRDELHDRGV